MGRNATEAWLSAVASGEVRPAIFVTATFVTGPIYVWTGSVPISWNGRTWIGVGSLGSISTIEEGSSVEAKGITLTFGGFDAGLLSDVLGEFQVGLPVVVYLGVFNATGGLITDPIVSWAGRMDQPTIDCDGQTASISINCENRLIDMNISVDRRYTLDDSALDDPPDLGFQFVLSIQDVQIQWGRIPSKF